MGDILRGLVSRSGAIVTVEGRQLRLGVERGFVYVNGLPAEHYRTEAEGLLVLPNGSMHLPQAYLEAHGLPSMSLHPPLVGLSVRLGNSYYLHALPRGQVLAGGPGLAEHDLLLILPGTEIACGGEDGIVFDAPPPQLLVWPETQRERQLWLEGAIVGIALAPALARLAKLVIRTCGWA